MCPHLLVTPGHLMRLVLAQNILGSGWLYTTCRLVFLQGDVLHWLHTKRQSLCWTSMLRTEWSHLGSSCVPITCSSIHAWTINEPHLSQKKPWRSAKSSTVQDTLQPIPGLISCAGVTGRWGLLSHAQNEVRWLSRTAWWCLLHLWTPLWSSHQGTWSVSVRQVGEGGMCTELVSFYHTLQVQLHTCGW